MVKCEYVINQSEVYVSIDWCTANRARILALTYPTRQAFLVEQVLLVAVEASNEAIICVLSEAD